ncbi:hypothetical protein ACH5RR_018070 [Cinchona calisaya]|uniref:Uncharacterized protein n=1 Tax=Cinchona calisaya TaxID=153742 RepID=A0ABD2ZKD9_9GENT
MEREIDLVEKSARKGETKAPKLEVKVKKVEDEIPKHNSTKKYIVLAVAIIWFMVLIRSIEKKERPRMLKIQGACAEPGGVTLVAAQPGSAENLHFVAENLH